MIPPIFISGFNKSGTTLLLSLLDNHEELIVFPEELHYFKNMILVNDHLKAIEEKTGFRIFLEDDYLKSYTKGRSWYEKGYPNFNKKLFYSKIKNIVNNKYRPKEELQKLILAFESVSRQSSPIIKDKAYWVSKTTQDEIFFSVYKALYKDKFHFLYVIRDPRDVYCSVCQRNLIINSDYIIDQKDLISFLTNWKVQVKKAKQYEKNFSFFHIVRYEDLVLKPKLTMVDIANRIGITFNNNLLHSSRLGNQWGGNSVFDKNFDKISTQPIGRYKIHLNYDQINILNYFLKNEIIEFGYDIELFKDIFAQFNIINKIKQKLILIKKTFKYSRKRNFYLRYYKQRS